MRKPTSLLVAALVVLGLIAAIPRASAQEAQCDRWDARYSLSANLRITGTTLGAGDGVYPVGPGDILLEFERQPPGVVHVKLLRYEMRQSFRVAAKALFWRTTVSTDTRAHVFGNRCAAGAEGVLSGRTLLWTGPVSGYRSEGAVRCEGSMCGKFGAPPPGTSPVHADPALVAFEPFQFSDDLSTFTMAYTLVSHTDSPKQTTYVALAGREMRRACTATPACR